jgi:protein-S-isoprenylcysteine O-methyltransferase Ste14
MSRLGGANPGGRQAMVGIDVAIGLIWIVFWVFWIAAAATSHASIVASSFGGATWVLRLFLIAAVLLAYRFSRHGWTKPHENLAIVVVGFALFLAGLAIAIWARLIIGRSWGMPMSQRENTTLVTAGPYGVVRHPIYAGITLAMLGTALAISNVWAIPCVVFAAYFAYSARVEERNMRQRFPDTYPAYMERTKMLVPFVF